MARTAELLEAPILAATTSTIGGGVYATLRGRFDTVILDEASQVTLPAALGVVGFARRFVLVGDHRQLPPIVHSEPLEQGPGLSESLFEQLAHARETDGRPGLVRLEEQYRMNAEICAFPSQTWYDGRLHPAPSVAKGWLQLATSPDPSPMLATILDPARPVIFVDLPATPDGAPRTNRRETELARLLLEAARRGGLAADDLAVIAPFRAQVAAIRLELTRSDDPELIALADELVDTVDRFQGSERVLVIYSFSSFGLELHPLMLDDRRLNVALTRARHKLILLGDLRTLRAHPRFAALESFCRDLYPDGAGVIT